MAGDIIEPFFLENVAGQEITVNDACYRYLIIKFSVIKLQNMDMKDT